MGRAIALVRFKDGVVLRGCYSSTSNSISQWLITAEDLRNNYNDICFMWDDEQKERFGKELIPAENIADSEDVEIFAAYKGGLCWRGKASRSRLLVTENACRQDVNYTIPKWVVFYFKVRGWDYSHLHL